MKLPSRETRNRTASTRPARTTARCLPRAAQKEERIDEYGIFVSLGLFDLQIASWLSCPGKRKPPTGEVGTNRRIGPGALKLVPASNTGGIHNEAIST